MNKQLLVLSFGALLGASNVPLPSFSAMAYGNAKSLFAPFKVAAGTMLLSTDFSGDPSAEGWTTQDGNADGVTWSRIDGISGMCYDSDDSRVAGAADEWLFTPEVDVEAGQDYLLTLTVARQGAFDPDVMDVMAGEEASADAMVQAVSKSLEFGDASGSQTVILRVSAEKAGKMVLGLHLVTPTSGNGQVSVSRVELKAADKAVPQKVADLAVQPSNSDKTVTLTWTNPQADITGAPIASGLKANVYENGKLVGTAENQEPGEKGSFTYAPETYGGKVTYRVAAVIGDSESEPVEATVNLDDAQGEPVLVKSFAGVNRDNASDWAIENNGGSSTWAYEYGNVFSIIYDLGSTDEDNWLISPAVGLETGRRYVLSYELKTSETYADDVDVTVGQGQNSAAQTQVVASYKGLLQNGFGKYTTAQFTVDEAADYYVGFHVTNMHRTISMRNLEVYYIDNVETAVSQLPADSRMGYVRATSTLLLPANATEISAYTLGGQCVMSANVSGGKADLSSLKRGAYIVKVAVDGGKSQTIKIMK